MKIINYAVLITDDKSKIKNFEDRSRLLKRNYYWSDVVKPTSDLLRFLCQAEIPAVKSLEDSNISYYSSRGSDFYLEITLIYDNETIRIFSHIDIIIDYLRQFESQLLNENNK